MINRQDEETRLPARWCKAKLGAIAEIVSGYGFPKSYQGESEGDYPFYKVADISAAVTAGNIYLARANNYISRTQCRELRATPLGKGTIVFAKIGEAIKLNRRAILSQDALVDNNVMGILNRPDRVERLFLFYFMLSVKLAEYSRSTTVPSIRKTDVESIEVPLPPLPEQRRIVAKIEELFSQLDAGVAALERVKAQLERYRQSVLKQAFEGKLTAAWREGHAGELEPASALLERIAREREAQEPTLGRRKKLPEGWAWTNLGKVGKVTGGITKNPKRRSYSCQMPYLRVANVYADELRLDDVQTLGVTEGELQRALLETGDLLIVEGNGSADQIGRVARWDGSIEPCVHQNHLIKVRLHSPVMERFVLSWLLSAEGRSQIQRVASSTSGLYTLSLSKVSALPVPVAPVVEQERVVAEIEQSLSIMQEVAKALDRTSGQAERLRQSILKRAFEGKLVPQDPTDEPAEKLLERMKQAKQTKKTRVKQGRLL